MRSIPIQNYFGVEGDNILFLLGNGESIKDTDLSLIPGENRMNINRAWKFGRAKYTVLNYDTAFFSDAATKYRPDIIFSHGSSDEIPADLRRSLSDVTMVPRDMEVDHLDLTIGWRPTHTGLLAIHIAWWMNADMIFLVGFDGYGKHFEEYYTGPMADHDRHRAELRDFYRKARELDPSTRIYNTNPGNAYNVFPEKSMDEALACLERNRRRKLNEGRGTGRY